MLFGNLGIYFKTKSRQTTSFKSPLTFKSARTDMKLVKPFGGKFKETIFCCIFLTPNKNAF